VPSVKPDWLLLDTLSEEPVVISQSDQLRKFVPISVFLRRSPHLAAVKAAVAGRTKVATELIMMTDRKFHGVQIWTGPSTAKPPERPLPGAVV
jgi:Domain of unknown function (DUF5593)